MPAKTRLLMPVSVPRLSKAEVTNSSRSRKLRYIPQLDGLRAVAISLVILHHLFFRLGGQSAPRSLRFIAEHGVLGVDIFFVLSGYLITTILLRSSGGVPALRHFYFKRILRIWPIYYLLLLAAYLESYSAHVSYPWTRCLFFVQNFLSQWPGQHDFDQTWSLCVEEHFYFVWPLCVLFLPRRSLPYIAGGIFLASPLVRLLGLATGAGYKQLYTFSQYRLDGIALGSLLALLLGRSIFSSAVVRRLGWSALLSSLPSALWLVAATDLMSPARVLFAGTLFALAFGGLLCLALESRLFAAALSLRPLRYVGRISYGLYMIHPFVFYFVGGHRVGYLAMLAALAISLLISALSWRFLELPILQFGDRLGRKHQSRTFINPVT